MSCVIYNKYMPKMNLECYNGLLLNLISDAALGLFLKAGT